MLDEPMVPDGRECTHPELYVAAVEAPDGRGTLVCLTCPWCENYWTGFDVVVDDAEVSR